MSHYHFNQTLVIPFDDAYQWISDIFHATGLSEADAKLVAHSLVMADARGVYSHGILRTSIYTKRILRGCVDTSAVPTIVHDCNATAVVDGHNAMGQSVGDFSMKLAIEKAKKYGIAFVTARGSNHYGTCAYYAMQALEHNMIGISSTIGGGNLMAPWGGTDARVGNNPLGIAIPAGQHYPVVLDMAQSVVAKGKIVMATKTHSPIPSEWAFDPQGRPTTDPEQAMHGTVRPIADYKGSGIAIIVSLLSSVISGAAIGATLKDVYEDFSGGLNKGQMFAAIDLSQMTDVNAFKERMDCEIDFIKASPVAEESAGIFLPGEPEFLNYKRQIKEGITYPVEVICEIAEIGKSLNIPTPAFAQV